jgi:polyisoprenoid-binding protein YceI
VDPGHSAINFRVRHLGIEWVNGRFGAWNSELVYDPANPEAASVTTHIRTTSVNSDNERRDNDIRSGNYLLVDSFPEISFVSRQVQRVDATHLRVTGDLTIRGVTRPVVLETEILGMLNGSRGKRIAFTATTIIRRAGIRRHVQPDRRGAQLVGDEVRITIDITAFSRTPASGRLPPSLRFPPSRRAQQAGDDERHRRVVLAEHPRRRTISFVRATYSSRLVTYHVSRDVTGVAPAAARRRRCCRAAPGASARPGRRRRTRRCAGPSPPGRPPR